MNIVFEMNSAFADVMPVTHYVQESSSRKFQPGRKSLAGKTRKCINPPPSRNRTKRQNQTIRKQHNNSWCIAPESLRISPLNFHTHFSSIFALKKVLTAEPSTFGNAAVAVSPSEKSLSETVAEEIGWSAGFLNASSVAAP